MNAALLAVALAAVAAPAPEEEVKLPTGMQPVQIVARVSKDGRIEITEMLMEYREEKRVRIAKVDGKEVAQEYTVSVVTARPRTRMLPEKGVTVYTAAGKEVDPKDLPAKLKNPTIAFMAWDGKKPDPFYLKPLKADVLVIVPPPPEPAPADGGPKPMPDKPPPPPGKEPVRKSR
jgi:hypothetical protein